MKKPVLTKKDFVRRYKAGEFGNASPTWDTYGEYVGSRYSGPIHFRNRIVGGKGVYDVPFYLAFSEWAELIQSGIPSSDLYVSAMAPTEKTLFQGEVMCGIWGLELTYTKVVKPMREALAERTQTARGLTAKILLQHFMCERSFEWLCYLLQEYPDHVVEFSVYSEEWGTVPGYNTVFWEVRLY